MVANSIRYGQLHEFDAENETVTAYLERAELYFDANDVADDRKEGPCLTQHHWSQDVRAIAKPSCPEGSQGEDFRGDQNSVEESF